MCKTIRELLKDTAAELSQVSCNPHKEAGLLLSSVLNVDPSYLYACSLEEVSAEHCKVLALCIGRRLQGEPLAYILGEWEFWSLKLKVNKHVLIPRPETELLVHTTLQYLKGSKQLKVLDLGTGSGAIALALATERPAWSIVATDKSFEALKLAQDNAEQLCLQNIGFACGDWFEAVPQQSFDAIISNPPYVLENDPDLQTEVGLFEPNLALFSGKDGLDALCTIVVKAPRYLAAGGWLMLEHGYKQSAAVQDLMQEHEFEDVVSFKDFAGHPRVTIGKRK